MYVGENVPPVTRRPHEFVTEALRFLGDALAVARRALNFCWVEMEALLGYRAADASAIAPSHVAGALFRAFPSAAGASGMDAGARRRCTFDRAMSFVRRACSRDARPSDGQAPRFLPPGRPWRLFLRAFAKRIRKLGSFSSPAASRSGTRRSVVAFGSTNSGNGPTRAAAAINGTARTRLIRTLH
jgi:hypothetical protein